jgi:cell division transport system ATP-binding protein
MITLDKISFHYHPEKMVLNQLSLTLEQGSFQFLTGPSGAGKTSLLGILSLAVRPKSGRIQMFGKNPLGLPRESLPHIRRNIGLVSQDFRLLNHLTVAENVAIPLKIAGESPKQIHNKVSQMLDWIGLGEYYDSMPETLSGGEKQRVAISRAVITKPALLLADEPTGNLDPKLSERLIYLFEALGSMGTTVLIATHDENLISHFNHPVLHLENGLLHKQ